MNKTPTSAPLLNAVSISKSFGGVCAVNSASLEVQRGRTTALIGPNGAGKTTLFNILTGLISSDSGEVNFQGRSISNRAPYLIARAGMGRTFQSAHVVTRLSVWENAMLGASNNPGDQLRGFVRIRARRQFDAGVRERAESLLESVGLLRLRDEYAGNLSGGQRKLLDFVRAMMASPQLLLLDEPFAGVNPSLRVGLVALIERLQKEEDMTFLLVEHDLPIVMSMSHHVFVMAEGSVIFSGPPQGVLEDSHVVDAYLGPTSRSAR